MARQEKSGAWNSTRERFNVVRMLENLPFDWKLENSVSWCIENQKGHTPRSAGIFQVLRGNLYPLVHLRLPVKEKCHRQKMNQGENQCTRVIMLRYDAASWMLFMMFPRAFDWNDSVRCPRFWTTDAATFWDTFWGEDCSVIMGPWEPDTGVFVFQRAIIASSNIVGQPSFSVITLA